MELDEKWIRAHLLENCINEPIDWLGGLYLDGLKVMSKGERGEPDKVHYEANHLIDKIMIGDVKKVNGEKVQEVRIFYNFVGEVAEMAA